MNQKIPLFLDFDDTIANSSEIIIKILNKKYNINPPKTLNNLKDYGYRSIVRGLSNQDVINLFESDDFWNQVQLNEDFLDFAQATDKYDLCFVTYGTKTNLEKKREYLSNHFLIPFDWCGIDMSESKAKVYMHKGIQIDNVFQNLVNTDASLKILIKNDMDVSWNKQTDILDNLYIVNNWKEILEILDFASANKEFYGL